MPHGAMADGVVWRCSHATLQVDHLILTLLLRWFQIHLNSSNTRTRGTRRHGRNNRGKLASTGAVVGTIRHACQIGLGNAIILGWDKPSHRRRRRASSRHSRPTARRRRRLTEPVFASPVIMYTIIVSFFSQNNDEA
jgi:hypothetical protein